MRKFFVILALLAAPTAVWAQGTLRVLSVTGHVEWRAAAGRSFVLVTDTATVPQLIQAGDELRTSAGAEIMLGVPDGSYMVVSPNSHLVIEDFWSGSLRSIMNLMVGRVRFTIQKLGGRPNPYSVTTPTALIAVRGTVFDVIVDEAQNSEVLCLEGSVTVENIAFSDREVVLTPGLRTLVRPNEIPLRPAPELDRNRKIAIHQKSTPNADGLVGSSLDLLAHDKDRANRPSSPQNGSNSSPGGSESPQRAKPTLTFP